MQIRFRKKIYHQPKTRPSKVSNGHNFEEKEYGVPPKGFSGNSRYLRQLIKVALYANLLTIDPV